MAVLNAYYKGKEMNKKATCQKLDISNQNISPKSGDGLVCTVSYFIRNNGWARYAMQKPLHEKNPRGDGQSSNCIFFDRVPPWGLSIFCFF
jgi:hypothetical protein